MFEGFCEGEIIPEERGTGGFGYDPIFLLPELGKTMAELSMDEKNRLSHRARAVMNARPTLKMITLRKMVNIKANLRIAFTSPGDAAGLPLPQ